MSHYKPAEAKAVSTSFQSFLWGEIGKIREAENEGDLLGALSYACSLVKYLPVSVKKDLTENVNQIVELVNKSFSVDGHDFHSTMVLRNKSAEITAKKYLAVFMNKLMRLLDDRGVYIEYKRKREIPTNVSQQLFEQ